jgi:hypothetical protein
VVLQCAVALLNPHRASLRRATTCVRCLKEGSAHPRRNVGGGSTSGHIVHRESQWFTLPAALASPLWQWWNCMSGIQRVWAPGVCTEWVVPVISSHGILSEASSAPPVVAVAIPCSAFHALLVDSATRLYVRSTVGNGRCRVASRVAGGSRWPASTCTRSLSCRAAHRGDGRRAYPYNRRGWADKARHGSRTSPLAPRSDKVVTECWKGAVSSAAEEKAEGTWAVDGEGGTHRYVTSSSRTVEK